MRYLVWLAGSLLALWSVVVGLLMTVAQWRTDWFKDWCPMLFTFPKDESAQAAVLGGLVAGCGVYGALVVLAPIFARRYIGSEQRPRLAPLRVASSSSLYGRLSDLPTKKRNA